MSSFLVRSPKFRFFSASLLFSVAALLFADVVIAGDAQTGPNFVVNTLADTDDGFCDNLGQGGGNQDCTLREAINAANAYGDGATITFSLSGTILLGSGLPQINRTMTIDGSGQSVVISGNDSVNIFIIFNNFKTLNLNALTIAHAQNNNFGGLFVRYANANITNCTFNDNYNTGSSGGAIWANEASNVVVANSTFYNNKATFGGGIHVAGVPNGAPSSLFVYNCTFSNNQVTAGGPVLKGVDIDANSATAEVRNSVLVTDASQGTWVNCQGISAGSNNIDNRGFCGETSYPSAEQINLDTLRDNGGPTKTVALLPGSVAIGAGDNTVATHSPVHNLDQRGFVRVTANDPNSDVGAFEAGAVTPPGPVPLNSVVSRMTHDVAGPFDINLTNGNAVECRSGGANGDYTLIFTFANPLVSADNAVVTSGIGSAASSQIDSTDAHNYVVNLTGVANAQHITVNVRTVSDAAGNFSSAVPASMGVLIGDVNGNRAVNASDVAQTKSRIGQLIDATNFRSDVNVTGSVNASDVSAIKAKVGTGLP